MARVKRGTALEVERDLAILVEGRLRKKTNAVILAELNELRRREAFERAIQSGASPEEAREIAAMATITIQTARKDLRALNDRLMAQNESSAKQLAQNRLDEIELTIQTLDLAERRAWEELDHSTGDQIVAVTRQAAKTEADGRQSVVPEGAEHRRTIPSAADPRWLERIESINNSRNSLQRERFRLLAIIGAAEAEKDLAGDDTIDKLKAHERRVLFGLEARLANTTAETANRLKTARALGVGLENTGEPVHYTVTDLHDLHDAPPENQE